LSESQWNVRMEVSPLQRTDSRRLKRQCPVSMCQPWHNVNTT
jgi:hypothetical protein